MTELRDDIEVLTPGQILFEGRQEAGLTLADVAERLNLRVTVIEAIEQDRINKSISVTFTKGYLRSYARLLGISEQEVLDSFNSMESCQIQVAEMQSFSQKVKREQQDSRLLAASLLIVILLGGSLVVWWQQQNKVMPDEAVQQSESAAVNSPVEFPSASVVESEPEPAYSQPIAEEMTERPTSEPAVQTAVDKQEQIVEQPVNEPAIQVVAESRPDSHNVVVVEPAVAAVEQDNTAEISTGSGLQKLASTELVLTFSKDCWVDIYDSAGERLAYGVKKSGRVMPVNGVPPFKIKLGAPLAVKIEYDGNPYPFEVKSTGQILNLTVPD